MKVGIGVTTHNRREVFDRTMVEIRRFGPAGARIVVVDDASTDPVPGADHRFEVNAGIARAKNKCLELLDDCDEIFLFDDDTYPIVADWHLPYITSGEPHLMYIFLDFADRPSLRDNVLLYRDSKITAYSHARGCMLYLNRICLEKAGGMNPVFGRWGWEHPNLSERIHNLGLTTFRYADVTGSERLIYSADEHLAVTSTVRGPERVRQIAVNRPVHQALMGSTEFVPYRETEDVIITCYFAGQPDPQRLGAAWEPDYSQLRPLIDSMAGQKLIILHNCFDNPDTEIVKHVRVEASISPYWQRWISILQYLRRRPDIGKVFCVDATDVEMLNNPFSAMGEHLYLGDEPDQLACPWMVQHHPALFLRSFIAKYARLPLLNAGLAGGRRELMISFIQKLLATYFDATADAHHKRLPGAGDSDMGCFNYTARTFFASRIRHGREVNTVFKTFDRTGPSWFRHK